MTRADNVATFMCRLSRNSVSLNLLEPYGPVQVCVEIALYTQVAGRAGLEVNGTVVPLPASSSKLAAS